MELAQRAVLRCHGPLALQHVHFDRGLAVGRRREDFRLLRRDGRVARNHRRRDPAQGFNREGQRGDVKQEQIFDFALEHAALNGRTHGDDFVGVDTLVAFFSEKLFHQRLDARHTGLPADQHDFVDLAGVDASVFHALLAGAKRFLDDVFDHRLELGAGQLLDQMLGTAGIGGNERQIDFGLHGGRELDLGTLGSVTQALQGHLVALAAQVEAFVLLELVDEPIDQALVNVVAAEVGITIGRLHFDDAFSDFQNRDIEGSATEVIDGDGFIFSFVESVGECGCRRLVDDALDFEAGNLSGVFGRLPLCVVEICRHRDDRFGDLLAEIVFRSLLQLLQDHRRDLGRGVLLALRQHADVIALTDDFVGDHFHFLGDFIVAASHEPLDRVNRVLRVCNRLALGDLSDESLAGLGESDYRWGSAPSFFIGNDLGLATLHDGNAGVGGTEVNSDNLGHKLSLLNLISPLSTIIKAVIRFIINQMIRLEWIAVKV